MYPDGDIIPYTSNSVLMNAAIHVLHHHGHVSLVRRRNIKHTVGSDLDLASIQNCLAKPEAFLFSIHALSYRGCITYLLMSYDWKIFVGYF